jgi:hypothetical protein
MLDFLFVRVQSGFVDQHHASNLTAVTNFDSDRDAGDHAYVSVLSDDEGSRRLAPANY